MLKKKNLKIGFSAETWLSSLYKNNLVTVAEVDAFKKECGYLLVDLVEKILERSYLLDQLLYAMHLSWIQEILLWFLRKRLKRKWSRYFKPPHKFKASCTCFLTKLQVNSLIFWRNQKYIKTCLLNSIKNLTGLMIFTSRSVVLIDAKS